MSDVKEYEKILEDLMAERASLDNMITWVQKKLAQNGVSFSAAPQLPASHIEPQRFPRLASDTFFRMTSAQAIKEFLNIAKRPKSAKVITAALQEGGLTHQAKNLYATVYPTLLRMEKAREVVRVGKREWGLSAWYSAGRAKVPEKNGQKKEEESA